MALAAALGASSFWLMAYATEYWQFLLLSLFVGLAGGSFSVGTPYVARWFPKDRQGLAMGVFGEKEPPARPTNSDSSRNCQYSVA